MMPLVYTRREVPVRGFTLVETLVYLGVMVLVASALVTTFLSLDTTLLKNRTDRSLTESASVSLERIVRAVRSADSIDIAGSTFGISPGVLELTEGATTTVFSLASGRLTMSINGANQGPLTSGAVTVEELTFTRYAGAVSELVRVALTLSAVSDAASSTRTFYTSAVVRGSYE